MLSRDEFECLVKLARRSQRIELQVEEDDVPTAAIMRLAETGGASDLGRRKVKTSIQKRMVSLFDIHLALTW